MKFDKKDLLLYAVTDCTWTGRQTLYEQVEAALQGGVTLVQLREKQLDEAAFIREAIEMKTLCQQYHVPLIINDRVNVALKSDADGVHVGAEDMSVAEIRRLAGDDFIIGATAKTVEQAQRAEADGADYLGVGAVFPSPTKTNAIRITASQLREICDAVRIPAVAIGGINAENLHKLVGGGMCGIAVVSAIFSAKNIRTETAQLKARVLELMT